ncbi:G/U mismatch-specific DNA glycosylase [Actinomadura parmotrematis]|uniref:G/U mismatch-specific DNA glycosylase n=1 Tax=Actinomadura parmotrematis TaxID=2864039 RepID=A0ABS7FPK5_9ACTN|nr:G/U mismatch-specific DNA glycosylase [Actinomadura parmotrematis]MBW8482339.1 G/U mismatch-specific DNA glycosylase [Actinomadura parmotrematis]
MRPTKAEQEAARDRVIPDLLPPEGTPFRVLFCGINPGLYSGATGHHFARPGNRFWPALHRSGFTQRQYAPAEQDLLGARGLGITNLAPRTTARADELTAEELREGGRALRALVERRRPAYLAVLGVTAYRTAFASPRTQIGEQEQGFGPAGLWILPNPSGLNASWQLDRIAAEFARLREAADAAVADSRA